MFNLGHIHLLLQALQSLQLGLEGCGQGLGLPARPDLGDVLLGGRVVVLKVVN